MDAALALQDAIRTAASDIEVDAILPEASLFQLYLPLDAGGPEVSPRTALLACEHLARADGSVGWCASVSSALSNYLGWLPAEGLEEIAGRGARR